jgi:hypothetical protein
MPGLLHNSTVPSKAGLLHNSTVPTKAGLLHNSTVPTKEGLLHNQPIWNSWQKQPYFFTLTAQTRKPGGQQQPSTLDIKFAEAYLVTWPNTRMDIVHPRSRQSPPAPHTTPPHLPTETRGTECSSRRRGHIATRIRRHSLCIPHDLKSTLHRIIPLSGNYDCYFPSLFRRMYWRSAE